MTFALAHDTDNYLIHATFHPHWCNDKGVGHQKLQFFPEAYPLRARFSQNLQRLYPISVALAVKISLVCSRGYGVIRVLSSGCLVSPKYSVPPSGETMLQISNRFGGARTCSRSSITMPSLVGLGFHPPPGWPKTCFLSVCLFVCLFVTLLNVRDCAPDFAMKALEYRNDFDVVG